VSTNPARREILINNKKMKKLIFVGIFLFANVSCNILLEKETDLSQKENKMYKMWREDKNGCLGYRNASVALYIRDSSNLIDKKEDYIVSILGKPDTVINFQNDILNTKEFMYFLDIKCENNIKINSIDYCRLYLSFRRNKLLAIDISCP